MGQRAEHIETGIMNLRKPILKSKALPGFLSWILANYLRFCFATTRWQRVGLDDLADDLKDGPVIIVLWHSRLLYGPSAWPNHLSRVFTLRDPSHAGRLSSATQSRLGMEPIVMQDKASNFSASRQILKVIRDGHSLGMTADGPLGPARDAKQAPLEWARATGRPVYLFSWSARRVMRLGTWDKLMVPVPFTRGTYGYRRWQTDVPRKIDAQGYTRLQGELSDSLDGFMFELDESIAVAPGD